MDKFALYIYENLQFETPYIKIVDIIISITNYMIRKE